MYGHIMVTTPRLLIIMSQRLPFNIAQKLAGPKGLEPLFTA